jgi:hypothetical protein
VPGRKKEVVLLFEIYQGGRLVERIEERGLVGLTSREEIHRILAEAGFDARREWSGYDFAPYQEGDALLIMGAWKRR